MTVGDAPMSRTRLRQFTGADALGATFTAAISLHAHTHYSNEMMLDLPTYIGRIRWSRSCSSENWRGIVTDGGRPSIFRKAGGTHPSARVASSNPRPPKSVTS